MAGKKSLTQNLLQNLPIRKSVSAKRKRFSSAPEAMDLPNLIEMQIQSYRLFFEHGLSELFSEISPVKDFTGKNLELQFGNYFLDQPKFTEIVAKERNTTFEAQLYVQVKLVNKAKNKTKTQDVYLGDFPLMINRKRRIPVTALLRVFGVTSDEDILASFTDVDTNPDMKYIASTLEKDPAKSADDGFKEVYKRIRPGDLATVDNAR